MIELQADALSLNFYKTDNTAYKRCKERTFQTHFNEFIYKINQNAIIVHKNDCLYAFRDNGVISGILKNYSFNQPKEVIWLIDQLLSNWKKLNT